MNITFTYAEVMKIVLVWKIFTLVTAIIISIPGTLREIAKQRQIKEEADKEHKMAKNEYDRIMDDEPRKTKKVIGFQTTTIDKDSRA